MSLTALFAAAAVVVTPAAPVLGTPMVPQIGVAPPPSPEAKLKVLGQNPEHCKRLAVPVLDPQRRLHGGPAKPGPLADQPPAQLEHAVDRRVGDCHIRSLVPTSAPPK